jgi:hypothetical protein
VLIAEPLWSVDDGDWWPDDGYRAWCRFCLDWHVHADLGLQEAACDVSWSPFRASGYVLLDEVDQRVDEWQRDEFKPPEPPEDWRDRPLPCVEPLDLDAAPCFIFDAPKSVRQRISTASRGDAAGRLMLAWPYLTFDRALQVVDAVAGNDVVEQHGDVLTLRRLAPLMPKQGVVSAAATALAASGKRSQADRLVELALERYELGRTPADEAFAVPKDGAFVARMVRGNGGLRSELAALYRRDTRKVASAQAVSDALLVLEGEALDAPPRDLHLRVARHGESIVVDLGDETGRAIIIEPGSWKIVDRSPVLFRRTATTAALAEPVRGGSVDELRNLLNVRDADFPLLVAWLVSALIQDIPHPALLFLGEQGTAKSTAARMVIGLVDPSPVPLRKPPKDMESWITAAAGSWAVALDNVSGIPEWLSDSLCRAVTGDGDVRRRLYSDGDLTVFSFRRALVLTSIDAGTVRGDLGERLLTVELERIREERRKSEPAVLRAYEAAQGRIVAGILDVAARVLEVLPEVQPDALPRMADYARVAGAVDRVLGTNALDTYMNRTRQAACELAEGDPFVRVVHRFIAGRRFWKGTAAELLAALPRPDFGMIDRWPKDGARLSAWLRRSAPLLRAVGIEIETDVAIGKGRERRRGIVLRAAERLDEDRLGADVDEPY